MERERRAAREAVAEARAAEAAVRHALATANEAAGEALRSRDARDAAAVGELVELSRKLAAVEEAGTRKDEEMAACVRDLRIALEVAEVREGMWMRGTFEVREFFLDRAFCRAIVIFNPDFTTNTHSTFAHTTLTHFVSCHTTTRVLLWEREPGMSQVDRAQRHVGVRREKRLNDGVSPWRQRGMHWP